MQKNLCFAFLQLRNAKELFHGSVRDWLDNYMEEVLLQKRQFNYDEEEQIFADVFKIAKEKLGDTAFLRYKGSVPVGSLPPAYFEAISMGILLSRDEIRTKDPVLLREAVSILVQSEEFRAVTGPGANSRQKLDRRVELAQVALRAA